jgi:type I site-specific restriction endonuclease
MPNETDARIIIDRLLRDADWDIEDKAQVSTEEAAADGRADYVLKDSRSRPLAVIEAKRFSIDPYAAKDQARAYAQSLPVHFVILSNGNDHDSWVYAGIDASTHASRYYAAAIIAKGLPVSWLLVDQVAYLVAIAYQRQMLEQSP